MKNRVFILGAGFSKALAGAPLVTEFIKPIYENAINEELGKEFGWFEGQIAFLEIIKRMTASVEHGLEAVTNNGTQIKNRSGIELVSSINIEHLCTLLDLNISRPFFPKGIGVDLQGCPIPFMNDLYISDLEDAKKFIVHYIIKLLLPNSLSMKKELISQFSKYIKPGDTIITFNYDILIEQALWKDKLWNPNDGYLFGEIDNYLEVNAEKVFKTKVPVIKLHGSINWSKPGIFDEDMTVFITDPFTHEPYFEGFEFNFKVKRKTEYRLLDSLLITPSFMKSYASRYEIELMKFAMKKISTSREVFSIGYSYPEADSLTCMLVSQFHKDAIIKIIDLNANDIADNLINTYGLKRENIIHQQGSIEDWIRSNFQFTEYDKYLETLKVFEEIRKAGNN